MTVSSRFSRRDFLKLSSGAALGLLCSSFALSDVQAAGAPASLQQTPPRLGRVAYNRLISYDIPDISGAKVATHKFDELLSITDQVLGNDTSAYNRIWYKLADGSYVYSGAVQPVDNVLNTPVSDIPKGGLLAELTVPFTDARWKATEASRRGYRLYYATTYWITAVSADAKGNPWYRIDDDLFHLTFYIHAEHLRIVTPEELTPLSPDVPETSKTIVVSLPNQVMVAYEDTKPVFMSKISSGVGKGPRSYASTPTGSFFTFFKRPAGHMAGGDGVTSYYDLPGVPWTSYINDSGVSFHGTYWHNDYGKPHSHGCINLAPEQAKWLYRWTTPVVPPGQRFIYKPGTGTQVHIY